VQIIVVSNEEKLTIARDASDALSSFSEWKKREVNGPTRERKPNDNKTCSNYQSQKSFLFSYGWYR
jgi:hypothetical protein